MDDASYDDDDFGTGEKVAGSGKGRSKSRRELPTGAVATLKAWLLSPEHFTHPYPTPQDQAVLMEKTGIDKKQLKNWFTNARRRIWKPMLKKQIEQGKLSATGAPLGGMPAPSMDNPHSVQAMRVHYQQAMQDQPQQQQAVRTGVTELEIEMTAVRREVAFHGMKVDVRLTFLLFFYQSRLWTCMETRYTPLPPKP